MSFRFQWKVPSGALGGSFVVMHGLLVTCPNCNNILIRDGRETIHRHSRYQCGKCYYDVSDTLAKAIPEYKPSPKSNDVFVSGVINWRDLNLREGSDDD